MSNDEFKAKFGVPDDAAVLSLGLKAGDVLAIVMPEDFVMDQATANKMRQTVEAYLAGIKVLVCPHGTELKVVRPC